MDAERKRERIGRSPSDLDETGGEIEREHLASVDQRRAG
jgi:hypothetical protein